MLLFALVVPAAVWFGILGNGNPVTKFDAKQIVVTPSQFSGGPTSGVTIRETVDVDFGLKGHHGYYRSIPNDFGVPTDVSASSPDADASLKVDSYDTYTNILIGDPYTTFTGQHRYVLTYTLPDALTTSKLNLDIIGYDEVLDTKRFDIVVAGIGLDQPECRTTASSGCELRPDGDVHRATIAPLRAGQGVTIRGSMTTIEQSAEVAAPPLPVRRDRQRMLALVGSFVGGLLAALGIYLLGRRLGRDEVGGSTAIDAAFPDGGQSTRLVTDDALAGLAATDVAPPPGVSPWQGAVALSEKVGSKTATAWFSELVAHEIVTLTNGTPATLTAGPKFADADPDVQERLTKVFDQFDNRTLELGTYNSEFASFWIHLIGRQDEFITASGWWTKFPPPKKPHYPRLLTVGVTLLAMALIAPLILLGQAFMASMTILAGVTITAMTAFTVYKPMLRARSAAGSAVTIRTEAFRKFLQASEGRHVEWAWQHGLLREYSAWAVALDAAKAWSAAVGASTVPPMEAVQYTSSLTVLDLWSTVDRSISPPASRSSSGSSIGGYSGGGGGGGGGSSGVW